MGILNVTPDSFYAGSRIQSESALIEKVTQMIADGADILDIGGYSSRPGALDIPVEEEIARVRSAVKIVKKLSPETIISCDTFRGEVARVAIGEGASMINDISGGELDPVLVDVAAEFQVPYVLMHMKGTPQTMSTMATYENVVKEVVGTLRQRVIDLLQKGIKDIVVDPGFGFAKTREHNFQLLASLSHFSMLERPLLIGLSRKSMVWKTLNIEPSEALNGTTVLHTLAVMQGVSILRVHDVKEAAQVIKLCELLRPSNVSTSG